MQRRFENMDFCACFVCEVWGDVTHDVIEMRGGRGVT